MEHGQKQYARHCLAIGLLLLLLVTITIYYVNSERLHFNLVHRRAFYNLAKMIACTTELSRYSVFDDYHDYGCWCGLGGAGRIMDDSDRCCSKHDECYTDVSCPLDITRYILSYNYKIDDCENNNTSLITCSKFQRVQK
ncbi:basic phospholipase A2-like [Anneissia japonica]|uniref:basic phospholipase A2-like n=1 Tax=Anneissia japonica TaxID=1529436 RepID=UPI001425995B|nr:basic phospholipase A2-like [Anneissia japonica]